LDFTGQALAAVFVQGGNVVVAVIDIQVDMIYV
jgi:hypothetical protein